jgi:hypothetical protein
MTVTFNFVLWTSIKNSQYPVKVTTVFKVVTKEPKSTVNID